MPPDAAGRNPPADRWTGRAAADHTEPPRTEAADDRRHRPDRPRLVVGARARVRWRASSRSRQPVRLPARCPATCRSSPGERARSDGETGRPLVPILLFIAGFTIVFTLLGAFASTFVPIFKGDVGQRIGGAVVIAFGVLMIGYALRRGSIALYAERRPFLLEGPPGRGRGAAARDGVRRRVDAVHRTRADGHPGDRGHAEHRPRRRAAALRTPPGSACRSCWWAWGSQRFMGAFGWVRRHYAAIAGGVGRAHGRGGRAAGHRASSPGSSRRSPVRPGL